jgi:hypothetical protein
MFWDPMLGHGQTDRIYMTSIQGFRFLLSLVCSVGRKKSVLRFRLIYTYQANLNNRSRIWNVICLTRCMSALLAQERLFISVIYELILR